ncbi:DUF4116 domain-containing protein [Vibrio sp. D431a]|uniref:DUF4116 domain-containing protein n=1 Tax=Vibrio sp. D431a TaxID=2837388 RepID=UPI002552BCE7|nr:DUF4116 domain-containing protein [Vibrio sp. D431a]MDK9790198.1 hypothetical protein [Vibrio sp. D431a]
MLDELEFVFRNVVNAEPSHIRFVSRDHQSEELCLKAVSHDGLLIRDIWIKNRTRRVCLEAINQNPEAIRYVPVYTEGYVELCAGIINAPVNLAIAWDEAVTLDIIRVAPSVFEIIPDAFKTDEICMAAIREDGSLFKFLPDSKKSYNLLYEIVKTDGNLIAEVDALIRDKNMIMCALRNNALAIQHLLDSEVTSDMCDIVMRSNPNALAMIPFEHRTIERCVAAVRYDNDLVDAVPKEVVVNLMLNFSDA